MQKHRLIFLQGPDIQLQKVKKFLYSKKKRFNTIVSKPKISLTRHEVLRTSFFYICKRFGRVVFDSLSTKEERYVYVQKGYALRQRCHVGFGWFVVFAYSYFRNVLRFRKRFLGEIVRVYFVSCGNGPLRRFFGVLLRKKHSRCRLGNGKHRFDGCCKRRSNFCSCGNSVV